MVKGVDEMIDERFLLWFYHIEGMEDGIGLIKWCMWVSVWVMS